MTPDIAFSQTDYQLTGVGCYMACHHNEIAYDGSKSAAFYFPFLTGGSSANGTLTNHAKDVIGNHSQFVTIQTGSSSCPDLTGQEASEIPPM